MRLSQCRKRCYAGSLVEAPPLCANYLRALSGSGPNQHTRSAKLSRDAFFGRFTDMTELATEYRTANNKPVLRRRLCRILTAMIDGGGLLGGYNSELVNDGTRWYVGEISVNPSAATRLIQLKLVRLVSVNHCQSYELAEKTRRRVAELRLLSKQTGMTADTICSLVVDEAVSRQPKR